MFIGFFFLFFYRYLVTLMHLIKGNIGCGMLAMGEAFKFGGLYLTLFILLYVWLITVYNMHVLVSCLIKHVIRSKLFVIDNTVGVFVGLYLLNNKYSHRFP